MQLTIESTGLVVTVDGVRCRVWRGKTASGIDVNVLVHRIMVRAEVDTTQFDRELAEQTMPTVLELQRLPPSQLPTRCHACDGTGQCDQCDGQGCNGFGHQCPYCRGTGNCVDCHGVMFTFGED